MVMYIKILKNIYVHSTCSVKVNELLTNWSKVTVVLNKVIHYPLHCLEFLLMTFSEKSMIST